MTRRALTFALLTTTVLSAQELQTQTPKFRVGVDAVRIDAVVTDKDGQIVRDLTAADFEILQDGKPQPVAFAQFVPIAAAAPAPRRTAPLKSTSIVGAPPLPAAGAVRREQVQRTLALVVDDLGMSVESLYYVKRALHRFVDESIQPGDLVALVRTGGSLDGLQPFTTDRRVLHAAIDNLQWNISSRSGVEAFEAVNQWMTYDEHATFVPGDFQALDAFRATVRAAGTLASLNLVIRGARELPGRKAVFLVSEGFSVYDPEDRRVREELDRVVDQATRAGVVVYSLDARGLQTGALLASDNLKTRTLGMDAGGNVGTLDETARSKQQQRDRLRRDTQEGLAYLAGQTGGFAVLNSNNLGDGLARASADVRDYYIIGYTPDAGTFAGKGKTAEFHKIAVRVKRPGLKVRSRTTFLGVSDSDESSAPLSSAQQLVNAAISPFTATDIVVRATTLPGFSPTRGLFVRALLHIDASELTFVKGEDGKSTASADVLGMVFDRDGTEVAHLSTAFAAALTSEAAKDALRDGIAYTLRVPIPRAGPYQMRFAVRDRESGKLGTAGEFVEVPDIAKGTFAISGIVLRSDADIALGAADADRVMISPSQAVRAYKPGAKLTYACEIYNAGEPVQLTLSIWRGTERIVTAAPDTLTPPPGQSLWFAAGGSFKLGEALPPGHYVLQLAAQTTDPAKKGKVQRATQVMDFEVK